MAIPETWMDPKADSAFLERLRSALHQRHGKNAAYRKWFMQARPGDRLPRGSFFRGREVALKLIQQSQDVSIQCDHITNKRENTDASN